MPPTPATESSPAILLSKTGQALLLSLIGFGVAQLTPFEHAHWWPEDASAFLPRLLRRTTDEPEQLITKDIDDEVMMSMGPPIEGEGIIEAEPIASDQPIEDAREALLEEVLRFASDASLPKHPPLRQTSWGLPLLAIEDPQGSMSRFYRALDSTRDGGVARAMHYGDSMITGDYITRTARRLLQKKFGDGGHGFVLAGRTAPWYGRTNLQLGTSKGWEVFKLTRPQIKDRAYGVGGATFIAQGGGEWVSFKPTGEEGQGELVSRAQVYYMAQPGGGKLELEIGHSKVEINTRASAGSRKVEIVTSEGPHQIRLRTLGGGPVRLFGVALERDQGVVYDSLGVDGTRAKLLKRMNQDHWHEQLRQRQPDLIILHYGTNESQADGLTAARYKANLTETVGLLRLALPGVSCLIVAPMDRAIRDKKSGKLVTRPVIKLIVRVQREVAYAQGCAFWNTWRAMGGEGSLARWYAARPQLAGGDLTHPTRLGADRIGAMLFAALMDGYGAYRERQPKKAAP
ncbi:hypothetical protein KKF91_13545 [Myxococcota bacterium]|nr:hypothetical protein [Myxococcota bacterium]MBU1431561.1 hypothetical protein [Myxococcota bacterium]MBU1898753.1 hypothetical protein [Myxococcota bacterium]